MPKGEVEPDAPIVQRRPAMCIVGEHERVRRSPDIAREQRAQLAAAGHESPVQQRIGQAAGTSVFVRTEHGVQGARLAVTHIQPQRPQVNLTRQR